MRVRLLETPASCAAGRRARTRRRCARGGAAPPRPAPGAMPTHHATGWRHGVGRPDPELPRRGGSRATARGLAPERGPVGGRRGGAPRQPLPGTREAWPQGVCWLSHIRVAQASPADASETRSEQPPGTAGEGPTLARQIGRPVVHEPVAPRTESGGGNDDGGDYDDRRGAHQALVHDGGALCRVAAFRPTVTPRRPAIVRQRRSYGPQLSGNARGTPRKRPLSPSRNRRHNRGVVRLRCSLSAPPDTPPTAPSGRGGARTGPSGRRRPPPCCGPRAPAPPP